MTLQVVILAAGMGTRLGRPFPKPLTPLRDGRSILAQQLANLREAFGDGHRVTLVVGFKMDLVMEAAPDAVFVYNESFDRTNTSKSLLKALRLSLDGGVLWLNGDVVFEPGILHDLRDRIAGERTTVCVNTAAVGEEEVKYTLDADGFVDQLSKGVQGGLGEAVGINYVGAGDKTALVKHLDRCGEQDYFERGIETAIAEEGLRVGVLDISSYGCVEVDFDADLERANTVVRHGR